MSIKRIRTRMSAYLLVILFLAATLPASSQNQANEIWYKETRIRIPSIATATALRQM